MDATADVNVSITALQQQVDSSVALTRQTVEVTSSSTSLAKQSGDSLHNIVEIADYTVQEVGIIASATVEQSVKSAEMVISIEKISDMATSSLHNMQDSTSLVQELSGLSEELKSIIDSMGNERRQAERCYLDYTYSVEMKDKNGNVTPSRMINISPRGVNLELLRDNPQLKPGTLVVLKGLGKPFEEHLSGVRASIQWRDNTYCGIELERALEIALKDLQKMVVDDTRFK